MPSYTDNVAPVPDVVPVEQMSGDDDEDTALLRGMLEEAKDYIQSFPWCDSVISSYFAGGVGKVFAIFLFKINSSHRDVDPWEWVFVGDIPPAYLPLGDAPTKIAAFETYLDGMRRWVVAAREGRAPQPEDCCPPVNVKREVATVLLNLVTSGTQVTEYQLFWFGMMVEDYLLRTSKAGPLLIALYDHPNATDISRAKILEIPEKRFGIPDLRAEQLRSGHSDWLAWAAAVGSRAHPKGQRNHLLKYFRKCSPMNRLIGEFVERVF